MEDALLRYIEEERAISRYKISLLRKGPDKPYKSRLISFEMDFASYPFDKLSVTSLDKLKEVMGLFRTDRVLFEAKNANVSFDKKAGVSQGQIDLLLKKQAFLEALGRDILDKKIKEVNVIQDSYFREKLPRVIKTDGVDDIMQAEGASIAKERARVQVLLYSLGRYIYHRTQEIKPYLLEPDRLAQDTYDKVRKHLDESLYKINLNIFKYYNDGIKEVPLLTNGSMGHNKFIHSVYPLVNMLDKYPGPYSIKRLLKIDHPFFKASGRPIRKKFVERGFGLLTPVNRVGNETVGLLYFDLRSESGVSLNTIMESSFFNYKVEDDYFKALPTKPVWELIRNIDNPYLFREVLSLLSLSDRPLVGELDMACASLREGINYKANGTINISDEYSKMLIAATRSESEHIKQACSRVDILINQIRNEYESLFNPNRDINLGRKKFKSI